MKNRWLPPAAMALLLLLTTAGCGSGTHTAPSASRASRAASSPATPVAPPTTSVAPPATASAAAPAAKPTIAVEMTPSSGIADGSTVHVVARGFQPNEGNLGVAECADRGELTGPLDCDLDAMALATADASGTVTADIAVKKGPFGNGIVCTAEQKCVVAVTQLILHPVAYGAFGIAFQP